MLKARRGKTLFFGLSEENIRRLQKDQPIKFNLETLVPGQAFDIVIFAGKTPESMMLMMQTLEKPRN